MSISKINRIPTSFTQGKAATSTILYPNKTTPTSQAGEILLPMEAEWRLRDLETFVQESLNAASPIDNYLLGWTGPFEFYADSNLLPVAGTIYLQKIRIAQTGVLTTLWFFQVGSVGTGMTPNANWVGVYDSNGSLQGVSADCSAAWTDPTAGAGLAINIPLTDMIGVHIGQTIFTAVLWNSTGVMPNIRSGVQWDQPNIGPGVADWHNPTGPYTLAPNHFRYMNYPGNHTSLPAYIDLTLPDPGESVMVGVS